MNVAGLSAHSNLDKAHEVANDCKRLNKALKEFQDLSNLYNNRERLFGIPITNVSEKKKFLLILFLLKFDYYTKFGFKVRQTGQVDQRLWAL